MARFPVCPNTEEMVHNETITARAEVSAIRWQAGGLRLCICGRMYV
jgi:hypothetical protein